MCMILSYRSWCHIQIDLSQLSRHCKMHSTGGKKLFESLASNQSLVKLNVACTGLRQAVETCFSRLFVAVSHRFSPIFTDFSMILHGFCLVSWTFRAFLLGRRPGLGPRPGLAFGPRGAGPARQPPGASRCAQPGHAPGRGLWNGYRTHRCHGSIYVNLWCI